MHGSTHCSIKMQLKEKIAMAFGSARRTKPVQIQTVFKIFCKQANCDAQMISGAGGQYPPYAANAAIASMVALDGCRGNAKMDD